MKESEFLELLNLYLDHEISAADAARLEAEVQSNPKRRAIYAEYCRMQKACKLLAVDLQEAAQSAPRAVAFEKRVALGDRRATPFWRTGYFAAGAASLAAACLAVVFVVSRDRTQPTAAPQTLVQTVNPAPSASGQLNGAVKPSDSAGAKGLVSVAGNAERNNAGRVTLVGGSLVLSGNRPADAVYSSAISQGEDQLAWVRDFQLVSLQERARLEQLRFEATPATLRPEGRQLGGRAPAENSVEMTAFRFVK